MALDSTQVQDLNTYQTLIQNLVRILDGESSIADADRQLSSTNITHLNTTIDLALTAIDVILTPALP
jgi:hypothetical protein